MITWNPPNTLFTIPYFNLDVRVYGLLFALGFVAGYYLMKNSLSRFLNDPKKAQILTDKLTSYAIFGCVIGARMGHVLFYDVDYYAAYPMKAFAVWEGGLASHGGALGVLLAILLFWKLYRKDLLDASFSRFLDLFCVPVALTAFFIRLGNFFNQEILGNATDLPWGILFPQAVDGGNDFPRHPVQLYEGLCYLGIFFLLFFLQKKKKPDGYLVGLFFILIFTSRFAIEFLKSSQGGAFDDSILQTGQILSIPFILAGIYLILPKKIRLKA